MTPDHSRSRSTPAGAQASDRELWSAICDGDHASWGILVRRYEALIYTVATRTGLSMTDAGDCFQQTWLSLYRNRKRITQPERLSAWLTTTAKREALRLRRKAGSDVDVDALPPLADPQPLADEQLESLECRARLEAALGRLDARCARLLAALFLDAEERSYDDIARDLGIPRNSLGPVRGRCLAKLRTIVEEEGWA